MLGPLLFVRYIIDLDATVGCMVIMFADDTKISGRVDSVRRLSKVTIRYRPTGKAGNGRWNLTQTSAKWCISGS